MGKTAQEFESLSLRHFQWNLLTVQFQSPSMNLSKKYILYPKTTRRHLYVYVLTVLAILNFIYFLYAKPHNILGFALFLSIYIYVSVLISRRNIEAIIRIKNDWLDINGNSICSLNNVKGITIRSEINANPDGTTHTNKQFVFEILEDGKKKSLIVNGLCSDNGYDVDSIAKKINSNFNIWLKNK